MANTSDVPSTPIMKRRRRHCRSRRAVNSTVLPAGLVVEAAGDARHEALGRRDVPVLVRSVGRP